MVNRIKHGQLLTLIIVWGLLIGGAALAQTTAFTYQGKLTDSGNPANGNYDLTFKLYDTAAVGSGTQQGSALSLTSVAVASGVFTVQLDFGACASCFNGAARYLEIAVKPAGGGTFTTLSPRQPVTSNPYAIKSLSAASADGLSLACVNCVTSSQIQSVQGAQVTGTISGSQINGEIPLASVPAGSTNYIQNTTTPQAASHFNVSGNGTLGGTLSANGVSVNAGGLILNDNLLRLRNAADPNHGIVWSPLVDGPEFRSFSGFRWQNGSGVLTERMRLDGAGNLSVGGMMTSTGLRVESPSPGNPVASFGSSGDFRIDKSGFVGGRFVVKENGFVGISFSNPTDLLTVGGTFRLGVLAGGGGTAICRNSASQISTCSSSIRYKTNIADWHGGLDLLSRLRPVSFDWKASQAHDLGLVAEEVAEVEPLLVTRNDKGEIEGVKYDRLGVVLINAIKEQQAQIEALKEQQARIEALQKANLELTARLAALERLMPQSLRHPSATAGRENGGAKQER